MACKKYDLIYYRGSKNLVVEICLAVCAIVQTKLSDYMNS